MLALLWLIASTHAVEVVVQYQPPTGQNAFVHFTDVEPGVERTVDVPGQAQGRVVLADAD